MRDIPLFITVLPTPERLASHFCDFSAFPRRKRTLSQKTDFILDFRLNFQKKSEKADLPVDISIIADYIITIGRFSGLALYRQGKKEAGF